ncbi:MAG: ABC transporter ATP-binding protein [Flavobacteriales bacterium]
MMLQVKNISFSYQGKPVLNNVSFEVKKGKVLGLLGRTGVGKTTLLKLIKGLMDAEKGGVYFKGALVLGPKDMLVPGHPEIQIVNQDFQLFDKINVFHNIKHLLIQFDMAYQEKRATQILKLCGLYKFKDRMPKELSGGQQQLIAIARALAKEPELILLDEPFSHLDNISKKEVKEVLLRIKEKYNTTFLFVTHDHREALELSDELMVIDKGKIVQKGKPAELYKNPKNKVVAGLLGII